MKQLHTDQTVLLRTKKLGHHLGASPASTWWPSPACLGYSTCKSQKMLLSHGKKLRSGTLWAGCKASFKTQVSATCWLVGHGVHVSLRAGKETDEDEN